MHHQTNKQTQDLNQSIYASMYHYEITKDIQNAHQNTNIKKK